METITLTPTEARRLAVAAQRLAGPRPQPSKEAILDIFAALGAIQIDPIRAVERTQLLVLWSRLGPFDPALLDQLQSEDRLIMEAWAHCASLMLAADYPLIHHRLQNAFQGEGVWDQRIRAWMAANPALHEHILERLAADGPLATKDFQDLADQPWPSTGWTAGRNVSRMLDFLDHSGVVMCVGRRGNQKLWHLREAWLPEWVDRSIWPQEKVVRTAAQRALKALGVATERHINNHFLRKMYPNLSERLAELLDEGVILPARIQDEGGAAWPGDWFIHRETLPLLEAVRTTWQPRTVFLSPFDNLICDRERTEQMFDFYYRIEIYVPKAKREYGYYVLPLLQGERFIGRMDSKLDRKSGVYHIHALYAESEELVTEETGRALAVSLNELAAFIGAREVRLGETMPPVWRAAIEGHAMLPITAD